MDDVDVRVGDMMTKPMARGRSKAMSDLISRQAAIDECDKQYPNIDRQDFKAVINAVPSADRPTVDKEYLVDLIQEAVYDGEACAKLIDMVDRPTGEWIVNISDYKSVCSVCGAQETDFIYGTEMWYGLGESKFCPNCGAKMRGDD
jgi:hypothetical protein